MHSKLDLGLRESPCDEIATGSVTGLPHLVLITGPLIIVGCVGRVDFERVIVSAQGDVVAGKLVLRLHWYLRTEGTPDGGSLLGSIAE